MNRLRFELEGYDPNGDDVRVHVSIDTLLDTRCAVHAGHTAILAGLRGVGAMIAPGPLSTAGDEPVDAICPGCGTARGRVHERQPQPCTHAGHHYSECPDDRSKRS